MITEHHAYIAGDVTTAKLLARIDALQYALGQATAALEAIADGTMTAKQAMGAAQEGVDLCQQ